MIRTTYDGARRSKPLRRGPSSRRSQGACRRCRSYCSGPCAFLPGHACQPSLLRECGSGHRALLCFCLSSPSSSSHANGRAAPAVCTRRRMHPRRSDGGPVLPHTRLLRCRRVLTAYRHCRAMSPLSRRRAVLKQAAQGPSGSSASTSCVYVRRGASPRKQTDVSVRKTEPQRPVAEPKQGPTRLGTGRRSHHSIGHVLTHRMVQLFGL